MTRPKPKTKPEPKPCPSCGQPTEQTVVCPVCENEKCVERCIAGNGVACFGCEESE